MSALTCQGPEADPLDLQRLRGRVDPGTVALLEHLQAVERQLDEVILAKMVALEERQKQPRYEKHTLQLVCSHSFEMDSSGDPRAWSLCIAGCLEHDPRRPPHLLSDLLQSVQVTSTATREVIFDWAHDPSAHFSELTLTQAGPTHCGDTLDVTIVARHNPPRFEVPSVLQRLMTAVGHAPSCTNFTLAQILQALHDYIAVHGLLEQDGPWVTSDRLLGELFAAHRLTVSQMVCGLRGKLTPSRGLSFKYHVWDDAGLLNRPSAKTLSFEMDVPSAFDVSIASLLADDAHTQEIAAIDAALQQTARDLRIHQQQCDLLRAFIKAPLDLCYWTAAQPPVGHPPSESTPQ